jgi:hypothetical protein
MDLTNFAIAFVILTFASLSIATSAIAIECYNKSPNLKQTKTGNYYFVIVNTVCSSLLVLACFRSMYNMYSVGFQ